VFAGGYVGDNGGALFFDNGGWSSLENCLFAGNEALYAGAVRLDGSGGAPTVLMMNCTVAGNRAQMGVGGVYTKRACTLSAVNCIFAENFGPLAPDEIVNDGGSPGTFEVAYSCVLNGIPVGVTDRGGNTPYDPQFASGASGTWTEVGAFDAATRRTTLRAEGAGWTPGAFVGLTVSPDTGASMQWVIADNGADTITVWGDAGQVAAAGDTFQVRNYRLRDGSPAQDAGTLNGAPRDDLIGAPRPQGDGPDMGAYEGGMPPLPLSGPVLIVR
jgi:hypothetical protein